METQKVSVSGFLNGTIRSRMTKRKKIADITAMKYREAEGLEPYRSFYLSIDKDDIASKGLKEGTRLTLGIVRVEQSKQEQVIQS